MNRGKIYRRYRNSQGYRRGAESVTKTVFCLRCLQFGHYRTTCRNEPYATCGKCFRAYFFGDACVCENRNNNEEMTLRMVKDQKYQRPCLDITIGFQIFEAFSNQSTSETTINKRVLDHINSVREHMNLPPVTTGFIEFPVKKRNKQVMLELQIREDQSDPVILGNDFFTQVGFNFTVDRVTVNERSPVVDNANTIDFLYNLEQGQQLKTWLDKEDRPMYNKYQKGSSPTLKLEPYVILENDQHIPQPEDSAVSDADVLDLHADEDDLDNI